MRGSNGFKFFLIIFIIGILTWITVASPTIAGLHLKGAWNSETQQAEIRTGIDIRGGVRATLSAPEGVKPSDADMATVEQIIGKRLDSFGIYDRNIIPEKTSGRFIIEIPWKAGEKDYDSQKLINETIKTALLTFREVDETKVDKEGKYLPLEDKIVLQGLDIKNATVETDTQTGGVVVALDLSSDGTKKFADATGRLINKPIAIFMDDQLISAPIVQAHITNGKATITGQRDAKEAAELAATIRSGALPFKINVLQVDSISPTLGQSAFNVTVKALMVSLLLVWVFMLLYYRLPGILANIALLAHTVIQLLVLSWMGISITLPGMAGIILTIGMGVDANIIIFERIKEELRNGKTLRAAIDVGFKRAFTAVLDANMTTLISAVVLYIFGTGPIQSFAITLGLGVALSFFTAVTASRILLRSVADIDIAKHKWLYGVSVRDTKEVKA
jgi:preprotein translocase subunit SecD